MHRVYLRDNCNETLRWGKYDREEWMSLPAAVCGNDLALFQLAPQLLSPGHCRFQSC